MPMRRLFILAPFAILAAVLGLRAYYAQTKPDEDHIRAVYSKPAPAPTGGMRVFHLGHSLVGRDMPAMLLQLAPEGHQYDSQLGWGTSLKEHWEGPEAINGFDVENDHPRYRDAKSSLAAAEYDTVILTEMVEIKDAIRYHDSARYLHLWAEHTRRANPDARIYLYETWHHLNDPDGWLQRLDTDLPEYWEGALAVPEILRASNLDQPVYIIPVGQVMASFVRRVEAAGGVGNVQSRDSLFSRDAQGVLDTIHLNDLGAYLVALTHYAVLYQRSPMGLPYELRRADGSMAETPDATAASLMQEVVWSVVQAYDKAGLPQ